jgi:hypothetical protein
MHRQGEFRINHLYQDALTNNRFRVVQSSSKGGRELVLDSPMQLSAGQTICFFSDQFVLIPTHDYTAPDLNVCAYEIQYNRDHIAIPPREPRLLGFTSDGAEVCGNLGILANAALTAPTHPEYEKKANACFSISHHGGGRITLKVRSGARIRSGDEVVVSYGAQMVRRIKQELGIEQPPHRGSAVKRHATVSSSHSHYDSKTCMLCGKADGGETMLLCDLCDCGFHIYCLTPPLSQVPETTFHCPSCTQYI